MREFQDKQKIRKRIYSKTSVLLLAIFAFFVAKGVLSVYAKERDSRADVELLEQRKAELQSRLDTVSANNERLKTADGIDAEIRSKFDVVKSDESVIVVVDQEIPMPEEDKRGFMKKFWDSVTGVFRGNKSDPKDQKFENKAIQKPESVKNPAN